MNFDTIASSEAVDKTAKALRENGFLPERLEDRQAALARIKELIPAGASVMNGSSRTLEEIGFLDYLKSGDNGWNNLHAAILAEENPAKQAKLRKESALSDFYLGSVHAATEDGKLLIASNTGSQLPHLVYTSPNLILVVGAQKITPDMDSAMKRLRDHAFPLENQRMKDAGYEGSFMSKIFIFNKEQTYLGRKIHILFVNEKLGF